MELTLTSGAVLNVNPAPFSESKDLFQAVLNELKLTAGDSSTSEVEIMLTRFLAAGFSSKVVEACLWKCAGRCTLNSERVTVNSFEPVERRGDYMEVMLAVAKENLTPFLKSLFAEFKTAVSMVQSTQK